MQRYVVENIERTLTSCQNNTFNPHHIIRDLNCLRKLLNGDKITGKEISEPLCLINKKSYRQIWNLP